MSKIKTYEARSLQFGDVCDVNGCLKGNDREPLCSGVVRVTRGQANIACRYGWERVGEEDGMVLVSRSSKMENLYIAHPRRTILPNPRDFLAKAYQDNGDYGSAAIIRAGEDITPDTQIALLAIKDALKQS